MRADVFRHLVELSDGQIEVVALVVSDFDIILDSARGLKARDALEYADTVRCVDDIFASAQLVEIVESVPRGLL